MKCLPVTMAACLATGTNRSSLDEIAKTADKILELNDRAAMHAMETPAPILVTPQQPDILARLLQKIEFLVSNISESCGSISSNLQNQICYYHRTYGVDAKKCRVANAPRFILLSHREAPSVPKSVSYLLLQKFIFFNLSVWSGKGQITIFLISIHFFLLFGSSNSVSANILKNNNQRSSELRCPTVSS